MVIIELLSILFDALEDPDRGQPIFERAIIQEIHLLIINLSNSLLISMIDLNFIDKLILPLILTLYLRDNAFEVVIQFPLDLIEPIID